MDDTVDSRLRPADTALVLIDFEWDVLLRPDGAFHGWGAENAHARAAEAAEGARSLGLPVIFVKVERRADYADIANYVTDDVLEGRTKLNREVRRLMEGTPGVDFLPPLTPIEGDYVVVKRRVSAFYNTHLEIFLRRLNVRTLLMGGVYTDVGVETTARDAFDRDYNIVILRDACASPFEPSHTDALDNFFRRIARVMNVANALELLRAGQHDLGR